MTPDQNLENIEEEHKYYIFKGRFKSNSLKFYGLFLIIFNRRGDIDVNHILVSYYSNTYDLEPHLSWEIYEESILKQKWSDDYNPSMTASLQDMIDNIAKDNNLRLQLFESIRNYEHDNIELMMMERINRIVHDKNLILETSIQEVGEEDFRKSKKSEFSSSNIEKNDQDNLQEDGAVILQVQLILAPVSGKPIYELKVGDKIMTKIAPNSDRANYFIDLLDLRVEGYIKPVPCEIVDIKSEGKNSPIEILSKIGPGIFGKCIEDERQVKLKMYNPEVDDPLPSKKMDNNINIPSFANTPSKKKTISIKISFLTIGLLGAIILIFLILLLLGI